MHIRYQHMSIRGLFDWLESRTPAGARREANRIIKQQPPPSQKKEVTKYVIYFHSN